MRFGVAGYDELNPWSDEFHASYPNTKFSYRPADPRDDFMPLPGSLDLTEVFRTRESRVSRGCSISYRGTVYMMVDSDGVLLEVSDGTRLAVHVDAITEEMYVEGSGRRWACMPVAERSGTGLSKVRDRRSLQRPLTEMQTDSAVREG